MILTPYYLINVATKNNKIDDIGLLFLKPVRIAVIAYSNTTDHVLITHFYCLKSLIFCDLWYCICFCFTEVKWQFFTRHWIIFPLFLWITSRFHHGILEPPIKINLCHCQFVLMLLNIHFFVGPLPCHHSWPNASCEHLAAYLERDVLCSDDWQQLSELASGRTTITVMLCQVVAWRDLSTRKRSS